MILSFKINSKVFIALLFLYPFSPAFLFASTSSTTQIILAPHFDDASLPLGGMLSKSTDKKITVTVFSGKPEKDKITLWDTISGFFTSDRAVDARVKENENALHILNTEAINLGFLDYQYRSATSSLEVRKQVKEAIKNILEKDSEGTNLEVYFPAYFGEKISHKDHVMIHNIVLDIIKTNHFKNITWYMFEDMPYTIGYYNKSTKPLKSFLELNHPDFSLKEIQIPLSVSNLEDKSKSISGYSSQLKAFHFSGDSLKKVIDFAKTHCEGSACEKVYKVKNK